MSNFGPHFKRVHSNWLFSPGPILSLARKASEYPCRSCRRPLREEDICSLQDPFELGVGLCNHTVWSSDFSFVLGDEASTPAWESPLLSLVFAAFSPCSWYMVNTQLTSAPTRITKIIVLLVVLLNMLVC